VAKSPNEERRMRVPIASKRLEQRDARVREATEEQAINKVTAALVKTVGEVGTAEKAFLTGNAAINNTGGPGVLGPGAAAQMAQGGKSNALIARVTANLAGGFKKAPEDLEASLATQGLSWGAPFPPGRPLDPFFGYRQAPRTWDYSVGENVQLTPRWKRVGFPTIKAIYEAYDVAQICVRHLINDVRSLDYNWEPIPGIKEDVAKDIEEAIAFFDSPDKRQPFRTWLAEWLQDVLRYDAGTLYIRRNEMGDPIALEVVDGTTMIPLVDYYGRRPQDETDTEEPEGIFEGETIPAFVQIIEGLPWDWLAADDIIYLPWNPLPDSQYGLAPLEAVLLSANTDIRFQWHFLQFFTEGTLPAGFMEAPPDQSDPNQIAHWQEVWDAVMLGDQSKLRQIRWVPNGSKFADTKADANKFNAEFPLYLMRRTCASFGVTPNDLGFTENVNRATGDTQIDVQFRVGTSPLLRHAEDVINLFVKQHLKLRCRIRFDDGQETEDRVATAQAAGIYLDHGVISVDEVRQELGQPIDKSRPTPRYVNSTRLGPIPLLALESMAGKIDEETYGPSNSQPPINTPFSQTPGVAPPAGTPEEKAAAEHTAQVSRDLIEATTGEASPIVEAGAEADEAVEAGAEDAPPPAKKESLEWEDVLALLKSIEAEKEASAGVTASTGIQGNGLEEDDDEEEEDAVKAAYVALSLRRWRDNSRNRLRKGRAPRKFVDPNLPQALHDEVWGKLERAKSKAEVDAAFAAAGKAQAGSKKPAFHSQADAIVEHYAPEVAKALGSLFASSAITAAIKSAESARAKKDTPSKPPAEKEAAPNTARDAAIAALESAKNNPTKLKKLLVQLHGDSILQGAHDAARASGTPIVSSLKEVTADLPTSYWDKWEPGHAEAAAAAADGGMREMLDAVDQTITGVTDTTIERIGNAIAEGLEKGESTNQVKDAVDAVVEDGPRSETIANTEYARAMDTASVQTYRENGVAEEDWIAEGDACPECQSNADDGPYSVGEGPTAPAHPECRCAKAPVEQLSDEEEATEE